MENCFVIKGNFCQTKTPKELDLHVLSITDEYKLLIKYMEYQLDDLPEAFINHLRGTWRDV